MNLLLIALTTAIFTAFALVFMRGLAPLMTLLLNGKGSLAAESHTYTLVEDDLHRKAASSDSLLKWGGARSLRRKRKGIYVGVST